MFMRLVLTTEYMLSDARFQPTLIILLLSLWQITIKLNCFTVVCKYNNILQPNYNNSNKNLIGKIEY